MTYVKIHPSKIHKCTNVALALHPGSMESGFIYSIPLSLQKILTQQIVTNVLAGKSLALQHLVLGSPNEIQFLTKFGGRVNKI